MRSGSPQRRGLPRLGAWGGVHKAASDEERATEDAENQIQVSTPYINCVECTVRVEVIRHVHAQ